MQMGKILLESTKQSFSNKGEFGLHLSNTVQGLILKYSYQILNFPWNH